MDSQARVGSVLDGRYRLDRLLGEGGMGTVYRAYHLAMERDVAVKVLRGNLAQDPTAARRFALEAKATTKVESPYAVKVFDFGITAEGEYFMVMEYLDGRTAQRELDVDGPLSVDRALHVARQALAALSAAHAVGVIHRDIKPENLLLLRAGDDPDACKVLDFGVAKLMASAAGDLAASALTKEGMVFGTPEFMSPEQACGQALDGRSDVYSLAATLFTLLTGKALFRGQAAIEILSKHVVAAPPHLVDQPGMSHLHALDQVLQRALAKRPEDRHRDAAELARDLAFLAPESPRGASMQSAPTMPTPALRGRTPDSPLGVVHASAATRAAGAPQAPPTQAPPSLAPTGSAPLAFDSTLAPPRDAPFSPGQTGYLPRLQPGDLGTQALM
ncbi:MAG TPA: serine/threonine-protein kinase, partial [Kofleriaceae bacterium]|nr:serine/threonine-protein kinase [Kofleriaceae bacterium]